MHARVCVCVCVCVGGGGGGGVACTVKPGVKETGYIYIQTLNLVEQQAI